MLTDEQIEQFQELYRKRFGKEISKDRALDIGNKLIQLMKLVYKPITKSQSILYEVNRKKI